MRVRVASVRPFKRYNGFAHVHDDDGGGGGYLRASNPRLSCK